jgi:hypothetical protein
VDNPLAAAAAAEAAAAGAAGLDPADAVPFFQRVDVWGTGVVLDYRPRRVSVAALREGSLLELINLVGSWAEARRKLGRSWAEAEGKLGVGQGQGVCDKLHACQRAAVSRQR